MTGQPARQRSELSRAIGLATTIERTVHSLTREQLSAASGISLSTLSRIETGSGVASIEQIEHLAAVFGISASEFVARGEDLATRKRSARQP